MGLQGLSAINIELNSTCFKKTKCGFCGHQKADVHTSRRDGEMEIAMLERIAKDVGVGVVVQFHRDGDPLDCSFLGRALDLFKFRIRSLVTHGERLLEKYNEIVRKCETVTVSMFQGDPDIRLIEENVIAFVHIKGKFFLPQLIVKWVGLTDENIAKRFHALGIRQIHRLLHTPQGNAKYANDLPTVPEIGICLDALHHPSIDWQGNVYLCNRLDPVNNLLIGCVRDNTLEEIWNGEKRRKMVQHHIEGQRAKANLTCATCQFWGVPTG